MRKDKRLYNYIVNTLGLSKETTMKIFEERLESIVTKYIANKIDSNRMEHMILNRITSLLKDKKDVKPQWEWNNFDDYIKICIKEAIENKLNKEYNIEVKVTSKE